MSRQAESSLPGWSESGPWPDGLITITGTLDARDCLVCGARLYTAELLHYNPSPDSILMFDSPLTIEQFREIEAGRPGLSEA